MVALTTTTNMKYTIQIPTVQFGLIAAEMDGTAQEAVALHNELIDTYKTPQGTSVLAQHEWNNVLDSYINGNPMDSNTYYAMSPEQQKIIQELKKCFKRLKTKNGDAEID